MKRFILVLAVVALMAVMLVAMAAPAFARNGPKNAGCVNIQEHAPHGNLGDPAFPLDIYGKLC